MGQPGTFPKLAYQMLDMWSGNGMIDQAQEYCIDRDVCVYHESRETIVLQEKLAMRDIVTISCQQSVMLISEVTISKERIGARETRQENARQNAIATRE
jgi:cytidylate kinase